MRYSALLALVSMALCLWSKPSSGHHNKVFSILQEDTISTVKIGRQEWMKYDLSTTTFQNGTAISPFKNATELTQLEEQAMPGYGMIPGQQREILYNYFAIADPRNICPVGFRVPLLIDFFELLDTLNTEPYKSMGSMEQRLVHQGEHSFGASYSGWCCMDFTDEEGLVHDFVNVGSNAAYWTLTEGEEEGTACSFEIGGSWRNDSGGVFYDCSSPKRHAFSVRCLRE